MKVKKLNQHLNFKVLFLCFITTTSLACEAPLERFCVDFYKGTKLQGKPRASQQTPFIRYDWENRSPARRIPYDNFSARWRGRFDFEQGAYLFTGHADDGVRIFVDGKKVANHWQDNSMTLFSDRVELSAGRHLVEVEYVERIGNAFIEVAWQKILAEDDNHRNKLNLNSMPMGINLSWFNYSSPAIPFKDLVRQSGLVGVYKRSSNDLCANQPSVNAEGYPLFLPGGCVFRIVSTFHILNDKYWPEGVLTYKAGKYVLTYQGAGSIYLGWDAKDAIQKSHGRIEFSVSKPHAGILIEVLSTSQQNPVRDIHIVHANDEASFRSQPFNERWLELLKPFKLVRFTDWGKVNEHIKVYSGEAKAHSSNSVVLNESASSENGVYDGMVAMLHIDNRWPRVLIDRYEAETRTLRLKSPVSVSAQGKQPTVYLYDFKNRHWGDRTPPVDLKQTGESGVAFEHMIDLANQMQVDMWVSVPTAADDNFVEQLAKLIKQRLKPSLKCYLEYSNETWNTRLPGYHYAEAMSKAKGLSGTAPQADAWHAYRAIEIFRIFNRVFAEPDLRKDRTQSRLVRVLSSQTAWLERAMRVMDWQTEKNGWPTNGHAAHEFADVWAATTYFYLQNPQDAETADINQLVVMQKESIDTMFGSSDKPGIIRRILTETKKRGLQLVAYEGGTHLLPQNTQEKSVAKLALLNKDQTMFGVYTHLLAKWNQLRNEFGNEQVGIWNHFTDVGRYDQHGFWGLLQSTYQPINTAPKYMAIRQFNAVE